MFDSDENKENYLRKVLDLFRKRIRNSKPLAIYRNFPIICRALYQYLEQTRKFIRNNRHADDDPEVLLCRFRSVAHNIEKGLQDTHWEKGHSALTYQKAMSLGKKVGNSELNSDPSYMWAMEKCKEYENAQRTGQAIPQKKQYVTREISFEQIENVIRNRRSVRSFENKIIPLKILEKLAEIMAWAPTSCNRQPAKIFITQNPNKVLTCLNQCAGATCIGEVVPCFISVCGDCRFYQDFRDRTLPIIDVSLGLQNLLLLAHSYGIEGTVLNWMHHTSKNDFTLRETLDIPDCYIIVMNLIIGYPKKTSPPPGRKSAAQSYKLVD